MTEEKFRELDDLYRELFKLKSHRKMLLTNGSDNPSFKLLHPFEEVSGGEGQAIHVNKFYDMQLHKLLPEFLPLSVKNLVDGYIEKLNERIQELEEKFNKF